MKKIVLEGALIMCLFCLSVFCIGCDVESVFQIGDTVDNFALPNQYGETVDLDAVLAGDGVNGAVLAFYIQDNSPGWTAEFAEFQRNYEHFASRGIKVIGISTDSVESHLAFAEEYAPDVTFLSDTIPTGSVSETYGIADLGRGYFVIDKERKLHYQYVTTATLLENQTATLLMEADKMTGTYTGNPDDYSAGGVLVSHDDDGIDVGNHAIDFALQAQCTSTFTLYKHLETYGNGLVVTFFDSPKSNESKNLFTDFMSQKEAFDSRGYGVIGISDATPEKHMEFAESLGVEGRDIVFFYDKNGKVGKQYELYTGTGTNNLGKHEQSYFIIDKNGVIRCKYEDGIMSVTNIINEIDAL